jgi:hypothetical protein
MVPLWLDCEIRYVPKEGLDEIRRRHRVAVIEDGWLKWVPTDEDALSWMFANILRQRMMNVLVDGDDRTAEARKAVENTLKVLEMRWRDVKRFIDRKIAEIERGAVNSNQ